MKVFDKILSTRPNTFVVFGSTGPVECGFSPKGHTHSGLSFDKGSLVPGGLSWLASGSGSVTFNGRFCAPPSDEGKGSLELIRIRDSFNTHEDETLVNIPNFLSLVRSVHELTLNVRYELTVMGEALISAPGGASPAPEHIVVNIDGESVTLIVDGESTTEIIPEYLTFTPSETFSVSPASGRLWGVVVRPTTLDEFYCQEVVEAMKAFPFPEEAEGEFRPSTFNFSPTFVEPVVEFNLEDLSYPDAPESAQMYNGSRLADINASYTQGWLNIPDTSTIQNVMVRRRVVTPAVVGSFSEGAHDFETYAVFPHSTKDIMEILPLSKEDSGEPETVYIIHPEDVEYNDTPISMTMTFLPESITLNSPNAPERSVSIDQGSAFVGNEDGKLFSGGLLGSGLFPLDPDADTTSEYPQAYSMWVYVSESPTGNIVKAPSFGFSIDDSTAIVSKVGISSIVVDGNPYTTGPLGVGWHHIAFSPTTPVNEDMVIGSFASKDIIYSFSALFRPSPQDYLQTIYWRYVDPVSITTSGVDLVAVGEYGAEIYANDWSISSAD